MGRQDGVNAGGGRIKQHVSGTNELTVYINAAVRTERVFNAASGTPIRWNNYIYAAGGMVAVEYDQESQADQTRYFHKDHLGSIAAITDEAGNVVERLSYDSWGMRRFVNGADDFSETIGSLADRGYTGHEHLQEVGLVHMNGRIYDPLLGRFMSADPFVQDPFNTQSLNRYSYTINNPLAYTDPNGYFFKKLFRNPVVRAVVAIAAAVTMQYYVMPAVLGVTSFSAMTAGQMLLTAGISGGVGGAISTGTFKGALIGAGTAMAFFGVGDLTGHQPGFLSGDHIANMAGHAAVGCASATAGGGKCGPGAIAGAAGSFAGPVVQDLGMIGGTIASAVVGGTASALGGGKFENGAITGAFGYLFNFCGRNGCFDRPFTLTDARESWQMGRGAGITDVGANEINLRGAEFIRTGSNAFQVNLSPTTESYYTYGTVTGVLNPDGAMSFRPDTYNFDYKNPALGSTVGEQARIVLRNGGTFAGRVYNGSGTGYQIQFSGSQTLPADTVSRLRSCAPGKPC